MVADKINFNLTSSLVIELVIPLKEDQMKHESAIKDREEREIKKAPFMPRWVNNKETVRTSLKLAERSHGHKGSGELAMEGQSDFAVSGICSIDGAFESPDEIKNATLEPSLVQTDKARTGNACNAPLTVIYSCVKVYANGSAER